MKRSKIFFALMLSIGLALALVGCKNTPQSQTSNDTDNSNTTAKTDDVNKTDSQKLEGELNIYTWDGMFSPEILKGFEDKTGVKINFTNFDTDEEMLAKLEETKGSDYDIVIADDYILEQTISEGLASELDKSLLTNIGNIAPMFTSQYYDKDNKYTIPFGSGIPLIVYDQEATGFEITGYEDLWNEKLKDSIALIGNYRVVDGIVLKTMNESFNTSDVEKIKQAGEKLMKLAPNVRLITDSNTQNALLTGEVSAAFLYTSQVNAALAENPNLKVCYPKEGPGFGIMPAFIPSNAPNKAAAHAFLNYIMEPEIGAKCFEFVQYFCTFKASEEFISDEFKDKLIIPEEAKNGEIISNIDTAAEDAHTKIWTEFKTACGA